MTKTSANKPSFLLYKSFYEPIKHLSNDELGLLFRAIFDYQNGLDISNLSPSLGMAFAFFKNQFDLDSVKYEESIVRRNQSNGSKGGRPKKEETQNNPENPVGFLEPKKPDKDKDNVKDKDKEIANRKRFILPTLEEVTQYCQERRNSVNPNKWMNHYQSKGWKIGKETMKDWKAAIRTWEGNDYQQQKPQSSGSYLDTLLGGKNAT